MKATNNIVYFSRSEWKKWIYTYKLATREGVYPMYYTELSPCRTKNRCMPVGEFGEKLKEILNGHPITKYRRDRLLYWCLLLKPFLR